MKKTLFLLFAAALPFVPVGAASGDPVPDRRIFVYGSDIELKFVEYVADLTGKSKPAICYLPTASGDHADNIRFWEHICRSLDLEPHVLRVWGDSESLKQSFAETLAGMDAVVVGGGNTLNMLGIWASQGIDTLLRQALDRGVILSGGSAGSLCWFREGVSDSRPVALSVVRGLGLLPFSHCPHYDRAEKRACYDDLVARGEVPAGYACDEHAGILFTNGKVTEVVTTNTRAGAYRVSARRGAVRSDRLKSRVLLRKGAIPVSDFRREPVGKRVGAFDATAASDGTPLEAFLAVQNLFAAGRHSEYHRYAAAAIRERVSGMQDRAMSEADAQAIREMRIESTLTYGDFAAVVSKGKADFYSLWYFVREGDAWKCLGEDIGGDTPADAQITFREKAPAMSRR